MKPLVIYISAAGDLMPERDALAQMIANIPVDLPWHIGQSPQPGEPLNVDLIEAAAFHLLIFGTDIRAPIGLEWHLAQHSLARKATFLKRNAHRTPAGLDFIRHTTRTWQQFDDAADLRRQVQNLLVDYILQQAVSFRLTPGDVAQLQSLSSQTEPDTNSNHPPTAHTAVLLSRARYEPQGGVTLE